MTKWTAFLTVLACLLALSPALAQETTGAIEGMVIDKTAGAIAGARVVARNVQTGFTKEAVTGADGFYRLLLLPVGAYAVTVDAPQFARLVRDGIQVNLSQTLRLNLQMDVTTVAETVTVATTSSTHETSSRRRSSP
jgi:hypothetical protein